MRLIDADAVLEELKRMEVEMMPAKLAHIYTAVVVENAPTIDAAPIVWCRDCRYYQDNNGGYPNADCKWCKDETPDANDYCSCGERNEKAKGKY